MHPIRRALAAGLVTLCMLGTSALAQEEIRRVFDDDIDRLAGLLGALAHLEAICESHGEHSRGDMAGLLERDTNNERRRAELIEHYNRAFRSVAATHQRCSDDSRALMTSYRREGVDVAERILATRVD